jgi:hypothetical protein
MLGFGEATNSLTDTGVAHNKLSSDVNESDISDPAIANITIKRYTLPDEYAGETVQRAIILDFLLGLRK